jgi:ribosomal protein L18
MSRIGRLPITVPSGVDVTIDGRTITVNGPKGTLSRDLHPDMIVRREDGTLYVERPSDLKMHRQLHGLTRTLVANMVEGVSNGFRKGLEITGVGYRAALAGPKLQLSLGSSHQIEIEPPADRPPPGSGRPASPSRTRARACATPARSSAARPARPARSAARSDEGTSTMTQVASRRAARQKRHERIRLRLAGTAERPRLAVFRSLNHIYAQVIDDTSGRTLAAASTREPELKGSKQTKTEEAAVVGRLVAERAKTAGVQRVVFDRAGFRYHGRIKSLADSAPEAGRDW